MASETYYIHKPYYGNDNRQQLSYSENKYVITYQSIYLYCRLTGNIWDSISFKTKHGSFAAYQAIYSIKYSICKTNLCFSCYSLLQLHGKSCITMLYYSILYIWYGILQHLKSHFRTGLLYCSSQHIVNTTVFNQVCSNFQIHVLQVC